MKPEFTPAGEVVAPGPQMKVLYTNHRMETQVRPISPVRVWYGSTEYHKDPGWMLTCYDYDKEEVRDYALKDCNFSFGTRFDGSTSDEFPELGGDKREGPFKVYVEDTEGVRLWKNLKGDSLEIWLDGKFQEGWQGAHLIESRVQTLLRYAYDMGKRDGARDNQADFRKALGLLDRIDLIDLRKALGMGN